MALKFLFDTSFDNLDANGNPVAAAHHSPADMESAIAAARAEGFAEGQRTMTEAIEGRVAQALEVIVSQIKQLVEMQQQAMEQHLEESVKVALAIGQKLAPALMQREPAHEVEAMITQCLNELREEPHIVVRTSDATVTALQPRIDQIAALNGLSGKIVLLPDDQLMDGDCRIEWADGGAERNLAALNSKITATINDYVQRDPQA